MPLAIFRTMLLTLGVLGILLGASPGPSHAKSISPPPSKPKPKPAARAIFVASPPTIDAPIWRQAPALSLTLNADQRKHGRRAHEGATARLAYDDQAIYLRVRMPDAELYNTSKAEQESLFTHGDVAEWFISRPPTSDPRTGEIIKPGWHFEMHVAPTGLRSTYFLQRHKKPRHVDPIPFRVSLQIQGTINRVKTSAPHGDHAPARDADKDTGWTVLMTLPWAGLKRIDPTFHRGDPLTVLVARYNFGHALPHDRSGASGSPWWIGREMTMWPTQPRTNFHLWSHHVPLQLQPPPAAGP